jgi:hypothetical protein
MTREPVHAARNETNATQTVHRSLHGSSITNNVLTVGSFRHASHDENRSTRVDGGVFDSRYWLAG